MYSDTVLSDFLSLFHSLFEIVVAESVNSRLTIRVRFPTGVKTFLFATTSKPTLRPVVSRVGLDVLALFSPALSPEKNHRSVKKTFHFSA
jgi:hypothetical protein